MLRQIKKMNRTIEETSNLLEALNKMIIHLAALAFLLLAIEKIFVNH